MVYIGIFNEYVMLGNTETYILSCHRRGKSHYFFLTTAFHPSLISNINLVFPHLLLFLCLQFIDTTRRFAF